MIFSHRHGRHHYGAQYGSRAAHEPLTPRTLMQQVQQAGVFDSLLQDVADSATPTQQEQQQQPQQGKGKGKVDGVKVDAGPDLTNIAIVELTDLSIKETKEDAYITLMYEAQPTQCKQCGLRFPDNASEEFKLHYDWHFRKNQERQQAAVVSRGWYLSETDWVKYAGSKLDTMPEPETQEQKKAEEERARTILGTQRVKAKDDQRCKICREKFGTYYDDEEEEWLLQDAIETDEGLFHISCYEVASRPELQSSRTSSTVFSPTATRTASQSEDQLGSGGGDGDDGDAGRDDGGGDGGPPTKKAHRE
ncbi:hypothetical protein PTSG_03416 [Salpingoeca rosetta]|uniref:Pcf11 C-terminal domain-containing protein n=1 Tax=Salpingoeca rosetta (strain ATCC 50818 / BSB-021) TaxID=946362 RepID=F2U550_SALR5|nr:uncharacterized protein PTSG_03416 [Salpingoeca rosetta]EGD82766.1 hypothetical protein PTSG_03416 [Salpingoeca rosetta]|eukprot:XP_004996002.1 hypothetical protein PTSG_03416 [Salpingoeca rosetta]